MQDFPKEYDATLGGQNPPPIDGAVLGGIKGVKQRFASGNENERIKLYLAPIFIHVILFTNSAIIPILA